METTSRRNFLKNLALAGAGATLPSSLLRWHKPIRHLGVQLWSIRDEMTKNTAATLEKVAKMGYKEVEGFGYDAGKIFGMKAQAFKRTLKNNGLKMPSSHCGFSLSDYNEAAGLSDRAKKAIDDAARLGQRYIIYPWVPAAERAECRQIIRVATAAAEYAQKAGLRFGYHNHDFEFTQRGPDGRLLMEWLLQEVDPSLICFEMDLYWVCFAQQKPVDWFQRFPGRWELCHVKDMTHTPERQTIEVGDGSIDFVSIFQHSKPAGLKYYIVELEHYATTPLKGIERARQNLLRLEW